MVGHQLQRLSPEQRLDIGLPGDAKAGGIDHVGPGLFHHHRGKAADLRVGVGRLDQRGDHRLVGLGVAVEQHEQIAAGDLEALVARGAETGVPALREEAHLGPVLGNPLRRAVLRSVIDDDDLELLAPGHALPLQRGQAGGEFIAVVEARNDDGEAHRLAGYHAQTVLPGPSPTGSR